MVRRKPPIRHKVSRHKRKGVIIRSYIRGRGTPWSKSRKSKRLVLPEQTPYSSRLIPITDRAVYPGPRSGSYMDIGLKPKRITLKKGDNLFHVSTRKKLKSFAPIRSSFSRDDIVLNGYVYILTVKNAISAIEVDDNDIQIDLGEARNKVEIRYMGIADVGNEYLVDEHGNVLTRFLDLKFLPQYKEYEQYFETLDREKWLMKEGRKVVVRR